MINLSKSVACYGRCDVRNKHVNAKSANQENSILSELRKSITDDRSVRVYIQVQLLVRIVHDH